MGELTSCVNYDCAHATGLFSEAQREMAEAAISASHHAPGSPNRVGSNEGSFRR